QTKLAAAEDAAARLSRQTSCPRETAIDNAATSPASRESSNQLAEVDWSTLRANQTSRDVPGTGDDDEVFSSPKVSEQAAVDRDWASSPSSASEWPSRDEASPTSGETSDWGQSPESHETAGNEWTSRVASADDSAGWGHESSYEIAADNAFSESGGE